MLGTLLTLATALSLKTPTIPSPLAIPIAIAQEVPVEKKAELTPEQEKWLEKLSQCESSGSTTIKVLDTNNKFSYGQYQFQSATFLEQGKKYGLIATTTSKVEPSIYDGELQTKIAHKMLLDGGEYHWTNCYKKIGKKYPK